MRCERGAERGATRFVLSCFQLVTSPEEPEAVAAELLELLPKLTEKREVSLAYGIYGSCLRHQGRISAALEIIAKGLEMATEEWDRASLLHRRALARGAVGNLEEALRESDIALLGFLHSGDSDGVGRVLTDQGMWRFHLGQYQRCTDANRLALLLLNQGNHSNRFACHQGAALAHFELGNAARCIEHLELARHLAENLGRSRLAHFRWLESRMSIRAGRLDLAESALRAARDSFLQTCEFFDASITAVALVEVILAQGRIDEATQEGIEARNLLLHLPEDSLAVPILAAVWKKAEEGTLFLKFLRGAIGSLEHGRQEGARNAKDQLFGVG